MFPFVLHCINMYTVGWSLATEVLGL